MAGGQPWIDQAPVFLLFCADFNRAKIALEEYNDTPLEITNGLESVLVGAVDVGIALGTATAAAESMGLGTVPIGAVRGKPDEIIELLKLPKYVFPVSGLVIGHPADRSAKKPRLPQAAVLHHETYQEEDLRTHIEAYDKQMSEYMKNAPTDRKQETGHKASLPTISRFIILTFVKCLKNKDLRRINKCISLPEHPAGFSFLKQKR